MAYGFTYNFKTFLSLASVFSFPLNMGRSLIASSMKCGAGCSCNASTLEAEARDRSWSLFWLPSKFEASLSQIKELNECLFCFPFGKSWILIYFLLLFYFVLYLRYSDIKMLNTIIDCLFQGHSRPGAISHHHNLLLQRSNGHHASVWHHQW